MKSKHARNLHESSTSPSHSQHMRASLTLCKLGDLVKLIVAAKSAKLLGIKTQRVGHGNDVTCCSWGCGRGRSR